VRLLYENNGRIAIIPGGNVVDVILADVEVSGSCWAMVIADRREVYSGILTGGQKIRWQAGEELYLKFGNINTVKVNINDIPVVLSGGTGPVVELLVGIARQEAF
jgi:hypothetical protein